LQYLQYTIENRVLPDGTETIYAGETHIVTISAVNDAATSYASQELKVKAICCPGPPQYLRGIPEQTNSRQIGMEWEAPEAGVNQCSPILEYKLFKNENRGITWDVQASGISNT